MIFPLGGLLIGALLGAMMARMRGGKPLDLAQWAAALAIIGGIIGLVILIVIDRMMACGAGC
jgi:hypothetical protein